MRRKSHAQQTRIGTVDLGRVEVTPRVRRSEHGDAVHGAHLQVRQVRGGTGGAQLRGVQAHHLSVRPKVVPWPDVSALRVMRICMGGSDGALLCMHATVLSLRSGGVLLVLLVLPRKLLVGTHIPVTRVVCSINGRVRRAGGATLRTDSIRPTRVIHAASRRPLRSQRRVGARARRRSFVQVSGGCGWGLDRDRRTGLRVEHVGRVKVVAGSVGFGVLVADGIEIKRPGGAATSLRSGSR